MKICHLRSMPNRKAFKIFYFYIKDQIKCVQWETSLSNRFVAYIIDKNSNCLLIYLALKKNNMSLLRAADNKNTFCFLEITRLIKFLKFPIAL